MRILVFEHESGQGELTRLLDGLGATIEVQDDADMAVLLHYQEPYDALVVAASARFSGLSVIERLRAASAQVRSVLVLGDAPRTVMTQAVKLGVKQVVLRALAPAQLAGAVGKLLVEAEAAAVAAPAAKASALPEPEPAPAPAAIEKPVAAREALPERDLLLCCVDAASADELWPLLPRGMTLEIATSPRAALRAAEDYTFRAVLVESLFGGVHRTDPLADLKPRLPRALFAAVYPRSKTDRHDEALRAGYRTHLLTPYEPGAVVDFLFQWLGLRDVLPSRDGVLQPLAFPIGSPRFPDYVEALSQRVEEALARAAAAGEDSLLLDLSSLPPHSSHAPAFVLAAQRGADRLGIALRMVIPPALQPLLAAAHAEGRHAYPTVEDARLAG